MFKQARIQRGGGGRPPEIMRIKNNLEIQIGRYQSRATCFDIILTEALAEVWMTKHVARDIAFWRLTHFMLYLHGIKKKFR